MARGVLDRVFISLGNSILFVNMKVVFFVVKFRDDRNFSTTFARPKFSLHTSVPHICFIMRGGFGVLGLPRPVVGGKLPAARLRFDRTTYGLRNIFEDGLRHVCRHLGCIIAPPTRSYLFTRFVHL